MNQLTADRSSLLGADVHIGVEHECKWEIPPQIFSDPSSFAAAMFDGLLTPIGETQDYLESVLYLDDADGSLARAGHTLSVVVNSGGRSDTCVISCKQMLHQRGWRDALEVRQRVPRTDVEARLRDPATLPVNHVHNLRLITGALVPSGVGVQRRFKRHGRTDSGVEVFCSFDDVRFGDPKAPKVGRPRYTCLEIEVNSSSPDALAELSRIAGDLDVRLGAPRDVKNKSQRARPMSTGETGW